jgi:DNA mismatch repair protein MutS2
MVGGPNRLCYHEAVPLPSLTSAITALEWDKITARLCAHALSGPGRSRCAVLEPGVDLDMIRISLEENRDARKLLLAENPLPLEGLSEIGPEVEAAQKGAVLAPADLIRVGKTARNGERVRKFFDERKGRYPRLAHHANALPPLRELADEIEWKIDPAGLVLDRASASLGSLRQRLANVRVRLQEKANEIATAPRYQRHVQESYTTLRSGRVVIPFKTAAKGLFQGIVHDTSQSGQTIFFEPEELVHLNNEVKMAEIEVEHEIARILAELAASVARKGDELLECRDALAALDFIQARALLAEEMSACEPTVTDGGETTLISARHPLMVLGRKIVVPNDIRLGRPYQCLVLTGPNAGGKTVALKTLGILTLMAMAGLSIPAEAESTVSIFPHLFVAVGDEQSVEQDLSTFSAHIRRLNGILSESGPGSMVLLDEVVSGTDPREGAAIARAFLEALADRDVRVVATTHFEELKAIAFQDRRFENGSMEFDPDRLRPTYRLRVGVPGRSMGMEIARSLGFPEEVLVRAATYLSAEGLKLAEVLDGLERERAKMRAEAAELAVKRREAEEAKKRFDAERAKAREEESKALAKARDRMREEVRKAEAQMRAVTEELRKERKIETVRKAQTVLREWKEKAAVAESEDPVLRATVSRTMPVAPDTPLSQGRKVFVLSLRKEGEIASVVAPGDREVEVNAGGMKVRVSRDQLRVYPAPAGSTQGRRISGEAIARGIDAGSADVYPRTAENTIDLRGAYVDDALPEIDAFLDRLALAHASHAFIIHGHGTGALKNGVRRHLRNSPYAKRFMPAPREHGGDGVTIVVFG